MTEEKKLFQMKILKELYYTGNRFHSNIGNDKGFQETAEMINKPAARSFVAETGYANLKKDTRPPTYIFHLNILCIASVVINRFVSWMTIVFWQIDLFHRLKQLIGSQPDSTHPFFFPKKIGWSGNAAGKKIDCFGHLYDTQTATLSAGTPTRGQIRHCTRDADSRCCFN